MSQIVEQPTGVCLIAGEEVTGRGAAVRATDPRSGEPLGPTFHDADEAQVAEAAEAAAAAAPAFGRASGEIRAGLLDGIADELEARGAVLVAAADGETALGTTRLEGELGRTAGQLRMFAEVVRRGGDLQAVIDRADADAAPPRPDLRRLRVPLGPVAVFGASNFPLAFSVAGGDTASALAVGCPVIAKAHPAHPATSEHAARAIKAAVDASGLPAGSFSMVHGAAPEVGAALVVAPQITAVGFTGSERGGRALFDLAVRREQPIPFYAEMGSLNPLFVSEGALRARGEQIAEGLVGSVTLGNGQFCTKPGIVVVPSSGADGFVAQLQWSLVETDAAPMLTPGIASAFDEAIARTVSIEGVEHLVDGERTDATSRAAHLLVADLDTVLGEPALQVEHFGPAVLVVRADPDRWTDLAGALRGNLTAGLHAEPDEFEALRSLVERLGDRAGRVLFDGFPTGVAVTAAQHHGGPYPAASFAAWTSVGVAALERWVRGVAFQGLPDELLPPALQDANPLDIERVVDGRRTRESIVR